MNPLVWTTDPPTEPGWYWLYDRLYGSRVVCVSHGLVSDGFAALNIPLRHCVDCKWAGPIPQPTEPEEVVGSCSCIYCNTIVTTIRQDGSGGIEMPYRMTVDGPVCEECFAERALPKEPANG